MLRFTPRELQALDELGTTRFDRGVRWLLIGFFLAVIVTVPIFESVADYRANVQKRSIMLAAGADSSELPSRRPHFFDVLTLFPSPRAIFAAHGPHEWIGLLPSSRQLRAFEDELLLNSAAGKRLRPWVQWALTAWLGTGSEKVLYGTDGWLYYNDGVQYVTGNGFLEPSELAHRADEGFDADPRPAILQLHRELQALGVTLIVLPIPDKAVVRPSSLSQRARFERPVQNPSWNAFIADLRSQGVLLLDLTQEMFDAERAGTPQFLRGDSHWSAAGIDRTAQAVARIITSQRVWPSSQPRQYERRVIRIDHANDLVALLDLPSSRARALGLHELVPVAQVIDDSSRLWQPDSASDILLIGDSFLEAFSEGSGSAAAGGLAEQVSYYLQQPVDRKASHLFGPLDAREALGLSLEEVRQHAMHRKIIVWEFAVRKLAMGNWPVLH